MLINVQSYPIDERSFIDVNTIQVNFKLAHASQYEVTNNGTKLRKIGGAPSDSRSCELSSKPRPGKFFARVKFNNDGMYSVIAISNGLVKANNQQQLLHGHREELNVLRSLQRYRDGVRRRTTRHRTSCWICMVLRRRCD